MHRLRPKEIHLSKLIPWCLINDGWQKTVNHSVLQYYSYKTAIDTCKLPGAN